MLIYLVFDIFSIDISSVFSNLSIDKSPIFSNLSVDIFSVFSSLSVEIIQKCVYFNTYTIYSNPIPQKRNTIQCSSSPSVFNSINIYILKSLLNSVTWSDRIWVNNEDLRGILEKGLRRSMLQGDNPRDWSRTLKQAMQRELLPRKGVGNAIFCTERLAITEVGRVQIEAQMMSYDVMGYDSLEVVTEPGACDICKPHDGEIVSVKDAQLGVNIPIFHPFCKCSTVAHMRRESLEKEFEKYENVAKNDDLGYNESGEIVFNSKQFGRKAGKHMADFNLDPKSNEDRERFEAIINEITNNYDEAVPSVLWRDQDEPVTAYIKGNDAVIVSKEGEFITVLKGGKSNARIKNARK